MTVWQWVRMSQNARTLKLKQQNGIHSSLHLGFYTCGFLYCIYAWHDKRPADTWWSTGVLSISSRFGLHQLLTKTSGSSAASFCSFFLSPDSRWLCLPFGAEEEFKIKDRSLARYSRISSCTHPETISPEPLGGPEARCRQTDSLRCPPDLGCGSRYT